MYYLAQEAVRSEDVEDLVQTAQSGDWQGFAAKVLSLILALLVAELVRRLVRETRLKRTLSDGLAEAERADKKATKRVKKHIARMADTNKVRGELDREKKMAEERAKRRSGNA